MNFSLMSKVEKIFLVCVSVIAICGISGTYYLFENNLVSANLLVLVLYGIPFVYFLLTLDLSMRVFNRRITELNWEWVHKSENLMKSILRVKQYNDDLKEKLDKENKI